MPRRDKTYTPPRLRKIEIAEIFEQDCNRDKLLQVRELIARALTHADAGGVSPIAIDEMKAALRMIDARLAAPVS